MEHECSAIYPSTDAWNRNLEESTTATTGRFVVEARIHSNEDCFEVKTYQNQAMAFNNVV